MDKREFTPIKTQQPDGSKIACRDCFFRDRTEVKMHSGRIVKCGITKGFCAKYPIPETAGKPTKVLFDGADCEYYLKDKKVKS